LACTKTKGVTCEVDEGDKSSKLIVVRAAELKRLTAGLGWQVRGGRSRRGWWGRGVTTRGRVV
jgi:hypothetical protein